MLFRVCEGQKHLGSWNEFDMFSEVNNVYYLGVQKNLVRHDLKMTLPIFKVVWLDGAGTSQPFEAGWNSNTVSSRPSERRLWAYFGLHWTSSIGGVISCRSQVSPLGTVPGEISKLGNDIPAVDLRWHGNSSLWGVVFFLWLGVTALVNAFILCPGNHFETHFFGSWIQFTKKTDRIHVWTPVFRLWGSVERKFL